MFRKPQITVLLYGTKFNVNITFPLEHTSDLFIERSVLDVRYAAVC